MPETPPPASDLVLYQTEDGTTRLEVRLENETVWLTQNQMAELFQTTQQNISLHLRNIYSEGELRPEPTHKEYLSVRREGACDVRRQVDYYNLDVIISVGYRVKSLRGTQFRIGAIRQELPERATERPAPTQRTRGRRGCRSTMHLMFLTAQLNTPRLRNLSLR